MIRRVGEFDAEPPKPSTFKAFRTRIRPSDLSGARPKASSPSEAAWELFLGVYCSIWGFRREARRSFPNDALLGAGSPM